MMLFKRPDTETLYSALVNKDPAYEGVAYVCVTSTKIFCRFTCTARKPKIENCRFRETIAECLEAGFRPASAASRCCLRHRRRDRLFASDGAGKRAGAPLARGGCGGARP